MTRRDYVAVARAFRDELEMRAELTPTAAAADAYLSKTAGIIRGAELIADAFAADNPRFDRGRFETAYMPREVSPVK